MVFYPNIRVPAACLGATIQGRRRRGRPSARGSDVGDVPEARPRERMELGKEYRLPKLRLCMLLTPFNCFLSAYIQQEPFAAEIIESDDDFAPPAAGAAPPAAGADCGAGGRGRGSGVRAGTKGRSAVRNDDERGAGARRSSTQPEVRGVLGFRNKGVWAKNGGVWAN